MFHEAIDLKFLRGTRLKVTFSDGSIHEYDMASMFDKYPQFKALTDRPIKGEINMAPIITAVELTFKPTDAIIIENAKIQILAPLKSMLEAILLIVSSGS